MKPRKEGSGEPVRATCNMQSHESERNPFPSGTMANEGTMREKQENRNFFVGFPVTSSSRQTMFVLILFRSNVKRQVNNHGLATDMIGWRIRSTKGERYFPHFCVLKLIFDLIYKNRMYSGFHGKTVRHMICYLKTLRYEKQRGNEPSFRLPKVTIFPISNSSAELIHSHFTFNFQNPN